MPMVLLFPQFLLVFISVLLDITSGGYFSIFINSKARNEED